jgi:hypothetical protein
MHGIRRFVLTALGLLVLSVPLLAQGETVFGSNGEVYTAKADAFGKLFPGKDGVDPNHKVLALEVQYPGQPAARFLVPDTEGSESENAPTLLFEEASHTLFIAWEAWDTYPALKLAGFDGKTWGEPLTVIGNPWALKTSPQLSVTRDSYEVPGEAAPQVRTILHLVWEEQNGSDLFETYYSPVLFENGSFPGTQPPVFYLGSFESPDTPSTGRTSAIIPVPRLVQGRHSQDLIVAFASAETNRFVNVEIEILPEQLGRLSDDARMHIIDLGSRFSYPNGYRQIADAARMHIIDLGAKGFQPEIAQAMAQRINDLILDDKGATPLKSLADKARMHIIDLGAKLSDRGLLLNTAASQSQIREVPGQLSVSQGTSSPHLLNFQVAASWPAPETGNGVVRFFPSKSGNALVVAWEEGGKVKYRETQGTDWSTVREIALSNAADVNRAYKILEERMSQH